jgi:hypothetical protein
MWTSFFDWIGKLPPSSASFVGTLTGSTFGLLAILAGAMFNAHLNRKRDDALRAADMRAVASALRAELEGIRQTLNTNAKKLTDTPPKPDGGFLVPDLSHSIKVMPHVLPKIGLLKPDEIQAVIDAYVLIEQHVDSLIIAGGRVSENMPSHRRQIRMAASHAQFVAGLSGATAEYVSKALNALDKHLE